MLLLSLVCDIGDMLHDIGEFADGPNILPSVFIDATDDADDDGTIPVPAKPKIYMIHMGNVPVRLPRTLINFIYALRLTICV